MPTVEKESLPLSRKDCNIRREIFSEAANVLPSIHSFSIHISEGDKEVDVYKRQ